MAKFYPPRLSKNERDRLLYEFGLAISEVRNPMEALELVRDLLSEQEAEMLAKRLKIAELLIDGKGYGNISRAMRVSAGTIARVAEWLKHSGDGYRKIVSRTKRKRKEIFAQPDPGRDWDKLKRKLPLTFWPQLFVEEIIRTANKKQRERLRAIIEEMKDKPEIYKKVDRALKESSTEHL